jgi:hypothetical protein
MKYRLALILSLLCFTEAIPDPGVKMSPVAPHPSPIYVNDAVDLLTSESSGPRIDYLNSLANDEYPIQVGAFRIKSNAERMYKKIASILGGDVTILEEEGFYKVRVTKLDKGKIKSYMGSGNNNAPARTKPSSVVIRKEIIPVKSELPDTFGGSIFRPDTVPIKDTIVNADPPVAASSTVSVSSSDSTDIVQNTDGSMRKLFLLNSNSPWLKRINYFGKSFAFVNALIITITISILTMIILLIVILLNRTRMEKEEKLKQYLAETYQSMIIDYLFTGTSPDQFRQIASNSFRRQALIDQMIDVSVNLKGDAEEKLRGLYLYLGLDNDSVKKAHDLRWHKKIKGFRELAFMNIKDANFSIYNALNSKNDILRMEAQIALVRLSEKDPFGFLFELKKPFSLWEQITLHELIIQHDLPVPAFRKWLHASNPTVVMFALRMIREFKQRDAEDDLREILEHPSAKVRRLAIQVAGDLDMRSTLDPMKRMYKTQDYGTCIEILRAMAKMPDTSLLGFLKLVLDKEDDVQLQIEATKAIENNGEEGVKALVKLMKSEYKNYNIIVRHVLDRRIF